MPVGWVAHTLAARAEMARTLALIVVTDISMPKMDGLALTAAIRADPLLRDVPILMLSGAFGEDEGLRAREAGVNAYLDKGQTEGAALIEAIRRLLAGTIMIHDP
jgi:two-component system chemotaxis sensor kinase CheA